MKDMQKEHISKKMIDEVVCGLITGNQREVLLQKISQDPSHQHDYEQACVIFNQSRAVKPAIAQKLGIHKTTSSPLSWFMKPAFASAIMGVFSVIIISTFLLKDNLNQPSPEITYKGSVSGQTERIIINRDNGKGGSTLIDFVDKVKTGDRIKIVVPSDDPYLMIISKQENGELFNYNPDSSSQSIHIQKTQSQTELSGSLQFDSYKGSEKMFFIYSRQPILFSDLKEKLSKETTLTADSIQQQFKDKEITKISLIPVGKE